MQQNKEASNETPTNEAVTNGIDKNVSVGNHSMAIDDVCQWPTKRLKEFAEFAGGGTPDRGNPTYWNGDIPWVSPKDMKSPLIDGAEDRISRKGLENSTAKLIPAGRLLMVVRSSILKHTIPVAINRVEVAINQDIKSIRLQENICTTAFMSYWIQGLNNTLLFQWIKQGATVESIDNHLLENSLVALPCIAEQQSITAFLDREASIIDEKIALISRKQGLLAELRKATIHEAVTKGLDKTVRMKNSTVNWMGEIPAPWRLSKLKNVCKLQNGDWGDEPDVQNEGIVCYRKADFLGNIITNGQTRRFISKKPFVEKYDILIEKSGGGDVNPVGSVAMVMNAEPAACSNFIARIRANEKKEAKYLFYFLIAQYNSPHIYNLFNQTTGIQNINMQRLMSCIYPSPPSWEQQEISEFLDRETELIDQQLALLTRQIELFREQRKALIHEVVTGKMRVI